MQHEYFFAGVKKTTKQIPKEEFISSLSFPFPCVPYSPAGFFLTIKKSVSKAFDSYALYISCIFPSKGSHEFVPGYFACVLVW